MDDPGALATSLRRAAARFGTPLYAVDVAGLHAAADELEAAFPDPWQRRYSLKANDEPAIVRLLAGRGLGANVVSRGEWALARAAGVTNDAITLEGVGKTDADLGAAVRTAARGEPLAWVAVESADELHALARLARRAGLGRGDRPSLEVLLRLNPDVAPETHRGLAVGRGASKFGFSETELTAAADAASSDAPAVTLRGIQLHVGSQLGAVDAWRDAVRLGLAILGLLRGGVDGFDTLDVGGGFPVGSRDGAVPTPTTFARLIPGLLDGLPEDRRPRRWAVEPGRFLVANAGWLVGRVLHVRDRAGAPPLVVLDVGMTELIRPALYGVQHPVVALTSLGRPVGTRDPAGDAAGAATRVEGPVCESTDSLGVHFLPPLRRGDLVAIAQAGAYADSMATTYNGRPRPPVVLIGPDGAVERVRRRGRLGR
ncbi:MAG TPA: hypothetical protein VFK54_07830 [Candidatus Limnocylindrales bacterium]|nr:hypothetical protein [Candidatus Limnocylindrales bacterium]